jgi:hypothetical protein
MWSAVKVVGYNTRRKVVVSHDNKPVVVCDSMSRASMIISYAEGNMDVELNAGIKKIVDKELHREVKGEGSNV